MLLACFSRHWLVLSRLGSIVLFGGMMLTANGLLLAQFEPNSSSQPSPQERRRPNNQGRVYRQAFTPQWFDNNTKFWYRIDVAQGAREFIMVDAVKGTRQPAFDHAAMASAFGEGVQATQLPVSSLEYDSSGSLIAVIAKGKRYLWDATSAKLTESARDENTNNRESDAVRSGPRTGAETSITFVNQLTGPAEIFWIGEDGKKVSYGKVEAGKTRDQHTFGGHRWLINNDKQESLGEVVANDAPTEIVIDGRKYENSDSSPRRRRRRPTNVEEQPSRKSPDGKWEALIEEFNVVIRSTETEQKTRLSTDGQSGLAYEQLVWSPDSQHLISFRVQAVDVQQVHLIRSSPEKGGRAQLESHRYSLPGDPFPTYELNVFSVATGKQVRPDVDRFESEWQRPRIRFAEDGKRFFYDQTDRGHGRFRLIEITTESAVVRNIIDEKAETFIWTAHTENQSLPIISWLPGNEIIHATEKNGWRQLILIDSTTGLEKRELTPRGIVVRGIDWIDEEKRRVWISASGRPNQDPYQLHFAHIDLDTGKFTWLTEADGNHSIEFSPDRKYLIDNYSRVDAAPASELRHSEDGQLVCTLEQADITELVSNGWTPPEVFVAKGRDGQTDIWGIICRPRDFDPNKKYPVIEDIYAGPHGSFVPKSFSPGSRHQSLTSLGFVVVQIDGMGTANRSKAFQDVCWKNLKDGGFEDRILWLKAAAAKYPELDLTRVGIYGTSAGGQNAAAAVLFHPDFYKVAVAACGCHDNRMDKASWNEQWMGYSVKQHYSDCSNIDNAHRLKGKLLLIVGEMDTNVPPESTLRFADALIRADKDFDLLVVPNAGHGMGGAYGQRRMQNYFVQHLLDEGR